MLAQSSDGWKTKLIGFLEKEIELTNLVPDVLDHSELLPTIAARKHAAYCLESTTPFSDAGCANSAKGVSALSLAP
jgi:hypothetical protein